MDPTLLKWMKSSEAEKIATSAQEKAWRTLQQQYPRADRSKFEIQANIAKNHTATAEVFFKGSSGVLTSVFGSDKRYWTPEMKTALGLGNVGGFPYQLAGLKVKPMFALPPIDFTEPPPPQMKKLFTGDFKIYATPDKYFVVQFPEIFKQTRLKHTSEAETKTWAAGPNMKYWPQQLNFAVFCATEACGVSREIFDDGVDMPPQIRAFYRFHVYFTMRRILFQLGGIQSKSALPGDPTFNQFDNPYDKSSYERICREFLIAPTSDFRFTGGDNHGLGVVYLHGYTFDKEGDAQWTLVNRAKWAHYPQWHKFTGKRIDHIMQDYAEQYDWFAPKYAQGLTQAGLSRINQSIEAFVYCILGSQVNVRSSILGSGGRAKEAQTEFLTLMEDAIRQPDLAKSVQRYQLAVDEAKVRLNLAVAPMAWLMPANMIINTASVVGYNNRLKQAIAGTKLGINNTLNTETKKSGLRLMDGGPSKVNPPNSHPSNPIHKAVMAAQNPKPTKKLPKQVRFNLPPDDKVGDKVDEKKTDSHEINKTAVIVGAAAAVGLIILATR